MNGRTGFALEDHIGPAVAAFEWLIVAIELFAIAILLVGLGRFLFDFLSGEAIRRDAHQRDHRLNKGRMELGRHIMAALEVFIVSDIIRTVVHFTLENILLLGALVLIRSLISLFLEWELRHLERESRQ